MKQIIHGLLYIALAVVITFIGATSFGVIGGIIGFVVGLAIIAIANRAIIFFLIGQNKYGSGDHETAYAWMKRAYDTTKLRPIYTLMYAYMMIRDGKLNEAENILNKVTYLNRRELTKEDLLTANINRALIKWKQGELGEAITMLEELHDKGMCSTTLYGTLGYFYILSNEISKALEFNKEGYEYNCDNMIIEDNLGNCYILNSEFEKADEIYKKLFTQNPEFIEPYYNYGVLLEKRGMYDEAKKYYEKALEFPEKYLSTITHDEVKAAIENMDIFSDRPVAKNDEPASEMPQEDDTEPTDEPISDRDESDSPEVTE